PSGQSIKTILCQRVHHACLFSRSENSIYNCLLRFGYARVNVLTIASQLVRDPERSRDSVFAELNDVDAVDFDDIFIVLQCPRTLEREEKQDFVSRPGQVFRIRHALEALGTTRLPRA